MAAILCRSCSRLCQKFISASKSMAAASSDNSSHRETEKVLVVHPKIRWGQNSRRKTTTTELQISEAVALCRTLPHLNVAGTLVVGTDDSTKKRMIWGPGRLEKVMEQKLAFGATALMINADMLSPLQQTELTAYFGVPIYDRFNIVLSIFKLYARTKEAHLQIALAELPYIRHRMRFLYARGGNSTTDALHVSEAAETLSRGGADAFELLRIRQHALQKQIKIAVDSKSTELQEIQAKCKKYGSSAVVAVVGYTNAGKTSLIQKLTDSNIYGEDRLFATLDTTLHPAVLPSKIRVTLADTIGFISNLPIRLFASFKATLKHVEGADLLIHIQDLSHPDVAAQREIVIETLEGLNIPSQLLQTMISVGNKIDCIEESSVTRPAIKIADEKMSLISCETSQGFPELIRRIDQAVQSITKSRLRRFRLPPNSKAIPYLYENDLVSSEPVLSECGNYLLFDVVMNDDQFAKFQANISLKLKQRNQEKETQ